MSNDYDHGVLYLPNDGSRQTALTVDEFEKFKITYVRVQWVDHTNTVRCRVLAASYFRDLLKSNRPGIGVAKVTFGIVYLITAPGFSGFGEYLYVPDLSTMRICPHEPGEAVILGWFQEKTPYLGADGKLSLDVPLCPRTILNRIVQKASDAGVNFLVGFETEFILLKSTRPIQSANVHHWTSASGLQAGSIESKVLREIADGIQASGIELQIYHSEAAPGQYEVCTGPLAPLEAADALVLTRELIINTAAKHGFRATFAPRINMDSCGSAAHTHISVHGKNNVKNTEGLSPLEESFLSSLLANLPALSALTLPIPASYKRMVDAAWTGGTYVNWGTENREAPIRLSNASSPSSRNFEVRCVDGTASPYLVLIGLIGTGYTGIEDNLSLQMKDCPGPRTAAEMTEEERLNYGITQRMPLTWEESRQKLTENELLKERVLGPELHEKYLVVNTTLAAALNFQDDNEEALTRLVEFY